MRKTDSALSKLVSTRRGDAGSFDSFSICAWKRSTFSRKAWDAAILFAPAGELVLPALEALDRGGTLAIAGIHLSAIPSLDYARHLFQERTLRSVTANTRRDGEELLRLASEIPLETHTAIYPLESANQALVDLKQDRLRGAAVLEVESGR